MKKGLKIFLIVVLVIAVLIGALIGGLFAYMSVTTNQAISKQENMQIDMSKAADGIYTADSDGGMVKVKVQVEVKDHVIKEIKLLEHENGKGKPAEVIIDDMVEENTDDVDGISGATISSKTIQNAVNKALQEGI